VNGKAVGLALAALLGGPHPAWFELEREAVPFTYSQYPLYLLVQGDHHAYQRIFFLQTALYGTMALLLTAQRLHWPRVVMAASLAATVLLAHTGSVLLDVVVLLPACAGALVYWWRQRNRPRMRALALNLGATAAIALALSLPALLRGGGPALSWFWVGTRIASPLWGFLAAQAGPLVLFAAGCMAGVLARRARPVAERPALVTRGPLLLAAAGLLLFLSGRGGAAVALACAALVFAFAPRSTPAGEDRTPLVILGAAGFCIWLFAEFVAVDLAQRHGGDWKRWNLAMRFWLEGYYLVPLLATLAFGPALRAALASRRYAGGLAAVGALVVGLWLATHAYAVVDRRARTGDVAGIDGTAFFSRDYPCDGALVERLRSEAGPVRIGELCGTGEIDPRIPLAYGWAGRIAAFSGRPGICGWTNHVRQFTSNLSPGSPTGADPWVRSREYERNLSRALVAAQRGSAAPDSRALFDRLGVTHLVLGDQERLLYPGATVEDLAAATGGEVEFQTAPDCGIVRLGSEPARP
jgi:hypothetical protein